jgi:protein-S-isoprenylcysteine O-methyltransferase Ste14
VVQLAPPFLISLILTIYWGRVLRLVYKVRRATGRSANFAPPEPVGRLLRIVWYPAVVVWIVHGYLLLIIRRPPAVLRPIPMLQIPAIEWIAVAVAAMALGATLVCWKRMGKSWRMGINPNEKTQLIITGPYAYVLHPIYALSSLLMLATIAAIPSPLMFIVGVVHLVLLQWEAWREEQYLIQLHGAAYEHYRGMVGRFLPRSGRPYQSPVTSQTPER